MARAVGDIHHNPYDVEVNADLYGLREAVRDHADGHVGTEAGGTMQSASSGYDTGELFAEYVDWREKNPSDDIVTEMMNADLVDVDGRVRRLTRDELLVCIL